MIALVGIHVLVPLLGLTVFVLLCRKMQRTYPVTTVRFLLIVFAIFGGWLMVCLTALFWRWSGLASIGVPTGLVAPFVTAGVALACGAGKPYLLSIGVLISPALPIAALRFQRWAGWFGISIPAGRDKR